MLLADGIAPQQKLSRPILSIITLVRGVSGFVVITRSEIDATVRVMFHLLLHLVHQVQYL